jgi:DNA-binding MarR family transcriptional regulator
LAVTADSPAHARISDEALETSKLLVEFLHATYATRRRRVDDGDESDETGDGKSGSGGHGTYRRAAGSAEGAPARPELSAHAVRAAIHIYQHGERTVGQLASGLGISYGWASRVVDELEAAHYLVRERDTADRRVVRVRLDKDALEDVERAYAWRGEAVGIALEPLSQAERAAVRLFLRRVTDLMREGRPDQV